MVFGEKQVTEQFVGLSMAVRNAPPHAGSMLESLRGLGYAPPTALADLVDNSITANSSEVAIHLEWGGPESWIRIVDDGDGMDDAALEAGMRLGASDPRAERAASDLGRFGLGLKTASFSQARRLTVASRQNGGPVVCLRCQCSDPWIFFQYLVAQLGT